MSDYDQKVREFREAPEWSRLRARWNRRAPAEAAAAGVTAEKWIGSIQDALLCLARCIVAGTDAQLASVLPILKDRFFSRDPQFHRSFARFARRWSELTRRHGEEADALLVEEALRVRLGIDAN
jgi:hypothetical protein